MKIQQLQIEEFLARAIHTPIIDVRTPAEYRRGHIPNAYNLPLFTNEERAVIGIIYAQKGPQEAFKEGLRVVAPRFVYFIESAEKIAPTKEIGVYCWRGGMRSQSIAFLLQSAGFAPYTLVRGYKAYRNFVLSRFQQQYFPILLGGFTGSAKTTVLHHLQQMQMPVIDLEKLANHRGSVFGHIGLGDQPTQQHFENLLGYNLFTLQSHWFWIEDESRWIGKCLIPKEFWMKMKDAPVILLQISREKRIQTILEEYGSYPIAQLLEATHRIAKKLGPNRYRQILELFHQEKLEDIVDLLLEYYDKTYQYALEKNHRIIFPYTPTDTDPKKIAEELVQQTQSFINEYTEQWHSLNAVES